MTLKEKRLVSAKNYFRGLTISVILRIAALLLVITLLYLSNIPFWIFVICSAILVFLIVFFGFLIGLSRFSDFHLTNNPTYSKAKPIFQIMFILLHLLMVVLIGSQLSPPLGQTLTTAYSIGLALASIILLLEVWVASTPNPVVIKELRDLKDDLIFGRAKLDEAFLRYQFLKEGITLLELMKTETETLLYYFSELEKIYSQQHAILIKFHELVPSKKDSTKVLQKKKDDLEILQQSYDIHSRDIMTIISIITPKFEDFQNKVHKLANQSGDYEQEKYITDIFRNKN